MLKKAVEIFNPAYSSDLVSESSAAMSKIMSTPPCNRHRNKRMKQEVSKAILDEILLDGNTRNELKVGLVMEHRKKKRNTRNTLKAMDLSPGNLSLASIE